MRETEFALHDAHVQNAALTDPALLFAPAAGDGVRRHDDVVRALLATPKNTAITLVASACLTGPGDWRPALDSLDGPVLYVAAPEVAAQAQMVRERRPDAGVEVFGSARHALFVDEPERFNRLLEEFLATLAEQRS